MKKVELKKVKKGEFFKRKENSETVFIKGEYERSDKKYCNSDYWDINRFVYLKGSTMVYTGFDF